MDKLRKNGKKAKKLKIGDLLNFGGIEKFLLRSVFEGF